MTTREYTRWTNERCKRGYRVGYHYSELYVMQQDEPYDVQKSRLCCAQCERESLD